MRKCLLNFFKSRPKQFRTIVLTTLTQTDVLPNPRDAACDAESDGSLRKLDWESQAVTVLAQAKLLEPQMGNVIDDTLMTQ